MTTFDARDKGESIDKIVFWKGVGNYSEEIVQVGADEVGIYDAMGEYVVVQDKQHGLDTIKALEKAIELK